jgi:hypothetical protein
MGFRADLREQIAETSPIGLPMIAKFVRFRSEVLFLIEGGRL